MNNETKFSKKTLLIVLLLLITIASVIIATFAWSKYVTTVDGTATAQVAKWNVSANTEDLKFEKTYTHVVEKKIAPGTKGEFSASLDVTGTEVDVDYTITINKITNKPTNLVLKDKEGNELTENSMITGTLPVNSTTAKEVISWEWPYETPGTVITADGQTMTGDEADTLDGKNANLMSITYTITAVQVQPE